MLPHKTCVNLSRVRVLIATVDDSSVEPASPWMRFVKIRDLSLYKVHVLKAEPDRWSPHAASRSMMRRWPRVLLMGSFILCLFDLFVTIVCQIGRHFSDSKA